MKSTTRRSPPLSLSMKPLNDGRSRSRHSLVLSQLGTGHHMKLRTPFLCLESGPTHGWKNSTALQPPEVTRVDPRGPSPLRSVRQSVRGMRRYLFSMSAVQRREPIDSVEERITLSLPIPGRWEIVRGAMQGFALPDPGTCRKSFTTCTCTMPESAARCSTV